MITQDDVVKALDVCLAGGCKEFRGFAGCARCGFNKYEDRRRKRLPLVKGPDGLRRRYVGIKREEAGE